MSVNTEWGLFNNEGCWRDGFFVKANADAERDLFLATEEDAVPEDAEVHEICPGHDGQRRDICEECYEGDDSEDDF